MKIKWNNNKIKSNKLDTKQKNLKFHKNKIQ